MENFDFTDIINNIGKMKNIQEKRFEKNKRKVEYPVEKIDSSGVKWIRLIEDDNIYTTEDCESVCRMKYNERGYLVINYFIPKNDDGTFTISVPCDDGKYHRIRMDYFDLLCGISRVW